MPGINKYRTEGFAARPGVVSDGRRRRYQLRSQPCFRRDRDVTRE